MFSLLIEHILSYIIGIYRKYEIENFGKPDVNGVFRAKKETFLRNLEILIDCILVGWITKHLVMLDDNEMHKYAYYSYWMTIECILMLTI